MAEGKPPEEPVSRPAASNPITLEQALLAPLDAIFTAQLHAARSFLNLLLQVGYPHQQQPGGDGEPYQLTFGHKVSVDGVERYQKISVPVLSLVPVAPLAVQTAQFQLEMAIKRVGDRKQMRESVRDKGGEADLRRPWYLVDNPISIEGVFAPPGETTDGARVEREGSIRIDVKIGAIPMPAGLDKLLAALTQTSRIHDEPPPIGGASAPVPSDQPPSGPAAGAAPPP